MAYQDKYIQVDGLKTRYIEDGSGPAVICLHGASLGSSADVFERNLGPLGKAGLRVIAYDQPGFGLTDNPTDYSVANRRRFVMMFMDVLDLPSAAMIGHSQAGGMAVGHAFERATILKENYPRLNLYIVDNCKYLVQWDAMDKFHQFAAEFLPN